MTKEIKEKIRKFLEDRRLIRDPRDIGLIILEEEKKVPQEFWGELNLPLSYFLFDNPLKYQNLENRLLEIQKANKILLIEIKTDPCNSFITILKSISRFGLFNIHDEKGNIKEDIAIKPGSIVVIAQRHFIENQITYPNFYNIFDTALVVS